MKEDVVHRLSRTEARRITVRAQLLDADRPTDLLATIRYLSLVQVDLTDAVAPSADLVCWSRLGSSYAPSDLDALLDDGRLVEFRGRLRPTEDMALYRADMTDWPGRGPLREWQIDQRQWVEANDLCRREILRELRSDGPLTAQELPDSCAVPWRSSGWTHRRNVVRLLDFMELRGEVAVASREGGARRWDLAERVTPVDGALVPAEVAQRTREERRLKAAGIARSKGPECAVEPIDVGQVGEAAVIEGVRGTWRVDPAQLGRTFRGRAAILSPLDRLIADRKWMADVFRFDYALEMYKPVAQRRWGYYGLPVLYGDRLVGKLDATSDHDRGVLHVNALHEDVTFSDTMRVAVEREIRSLARCLQLDPDGIPG